MEKFFKSIVETDTAPVVVCNLSHEIIYLNKTAAEKYAKSGGYGLVGKSLFDCHNEDSNSKIRKVVDWFKQSKQNNRIFTYHNPKDNKDVYMIALREDDGRLIGYYEKHEYRTPETEKPYTACE